MLKTRAASPHMAPKPRAYASARARASAHEPARAGVWERGRMRRAGGRGAGQGRGEPGKGGALGAGSLKSKRPPRAVYIRVLSLTTRFLEPFSEGFFEGEPRLLRR